MHSSFLVTLLPIPSGSRVYISHVYKYNRRRHVQIHEEAPEDGEHETLETVCENACLETATKEAFNSVDGDDSTSSRGIPNFGVINLAVRLEHAQRVGNRVRHDRRGKANKCASQEVLEHTVRDGQCSLEIVVGPEPLQIINEMCAKNSP
jgi:hypothetical protein